MKICVEIKTVSDRREGSFVVLGDILQSPDATPRLLPIIISRTDAAIIMRSRYAADAQCASMPTFLVDALHKFGICVTEVYVYACDCGIYKTKVTLQMAERREEVSARISDALALAACSHAPIYVESALFDRVKVVDLSKESDKIHTPSDTDLSLMSEQQLKNLMQDAVDREAYEQAQRIKEELDRRRGQGKS